MVGADGWQDKMANKWKMYGVMTTKEKIWYLERNVYDWQGMGGWIFDKGEYCMTTWKMSLPGRIVGTKSPRLESRKVEKQVWPLVDL